jgi:hypothetical protein
MSRRGTSIPIAPWWYDAIRREMGEMSQARLAELVDDIPANVSRCLNGTAPTLHLIVKISDKLRVARPVFLPQTEQEALAIHGALGLRAADTEIAAMHAEIDEEERDLLAKRKPPKP